MANWVVELKIPRFAVTPSPWRFSPPNPKWPEVTCIGDLNLNSKFLDSLLHRAPSCWAQDPDPDLSANPNPKWPLITCIKRNWTQMASFWTADEIQDKTTELMTKAPCCNFPHDQFHRSKWWTGHRDWPRLLRANTPTSFPMRSVGLCIYAAEPMNFLTAAPHTCPTIWPMKLTTGKMSCKKQT